MLYFLLQYNNYEICSWDLGVSDRIKPFWRHYYENTQGLIFVIDSTDTNNFQKAKDEFYAIAQVKEIKECPILVFINKMDAENAKSIDEIQNILQLD